MNFFNPDIPVISKKKSAFEMTAPGLLRVHWQVGEFTIHSSFYTKHDQACLLWSALSGSLFVIAQFLPVSWVTQAIVASVVTLIGVAGMIYLTWYLTTAERRLAIVLFSWVGLMLTGAIVTDLSIFLSWLPVLMNICTFWLSLSAIGYLITAIGMRSRAFFLAAMLHLLAIGILPHVGQWQPLTTGIVIALSVYLIAELQWDSNGVCGHQGQQTQQERAWVEEWVESLN
jgi:hypothetical protein